MSKHDFQPTDATDDTPPQLPTHQFQLRHATISDLTPLLRKCDITSVGLVTTYLHRISEVNTTFNAIIRISPSALKDAEALDHEAQSDGRRGLLHDIPILLKDNICTLDGTDTTCGSYDLIGARPAQEADVVTALRKAGAVVLGKGNMAEWSGFRSTSGCSGWSARGGQDTGIFYPGMKASGSSGGCAISVALGLCFAAIGTEVCVWW